jgi:hypothetical protein
MSLTGAQVTAIQTFLLATPSIMPAVRAGQTDVVTGFLNADSTMKVWRTFTNINDINNNINWANFTPSTIATGGGQDAMNFMLACQGKQFNLQNLINSANRSGQLATGLGNIRAGLQDSLTGIQSGAAGAILGGGWANVQLAIQRFASNYESLFATGTGTQASPASLVYEGPISRIDAAFCFLNDDGTIKI